MSNPEEHKQKENSSPKEVSIVSGKVSIDYEAKPFKDIANAINKENLTQHQKTEEGNGIAIRQADAQERANKINQRLFIANLFMFAITAGIFLWNVKGVREATRAA